jgi:hypothetical protein
MNKKLALWFIVVLLLAGCVPSLNPVFTEKDLVFDASVLGVWVQPNARAQWQLSRHSENSYRVVYTDKNGHEGRFVAHLANVDGTKFLDMFPEQMESDAGGFYNIHLVPTHTIYRVLQSKPNLELAAIDYKWFDQHLNDSPDAIQHVTFNGRKLITAPTEDLQAFVVKHKDKFTSTVTLERQPENAK